MEQVLYFGFALAFGAVMFFLGQNSVRLVGQRVETQWPSDRRMVTETTASKPGNVYHAPADDDGPSVIVPPRWRDVAEKMRQEGGRS